MTSAGTLSTLSAQLIRAELENDVGEKFSNSAEPWFEINFVKRDSECPYKVKWQDSLQASW